MRLSKLLGERFREKPADANMPSHIYLLRGGYMRQVASGVFSLLMPAKRVAAKIENIIREEMDRIDGQEVMMPVVLPGELWKESGRWDAVGSELLRIKDRAGMDMLLAMTHEEAVVHLARSEALSYSKYPFMLYQIQTKFRDEPRSRGGLIRVREFTMKDAYSFHTSQEDLEEYYMRCYDAYNRIYARAGVPSVIAVKSDTGMMGGNVAHEFMLLNEFGEDSLVICEHCGFSANMEVAKSIVPSRNKAETEISLEHTPDTKTIEDVCAFLGESPKDSIKAVVFGTPKDDKPVIVFIRGDLEVNEAKLKKVIGSEIFAYANYEASNLSFGFIGPYNLEVDGTVIFDNSLKGENSLVCGGNKYDYHYKGVCMTRDVPDAKFYDVAKVTDGGICPECGKEVSIKRGIEVGNIFQLGTKYSKSMGMEYIDQNGERKTPIMGCYGIGVGRLLACVIEDHHDDWGPIWPISVAPWQVHVCCLNNQVEEINQKAEEIYNNLSKKYEAVFDDRKVSTGVAFADADLLGVPVRVIVSKKGLSNGEVEVVTRDKSVKVTVKAEDVYTAVDEAIAKMWEKISI